MKGGGRKGGNIPEHWFPLYTASYDQLVRFFVPKNSDFLHSRGGQLCINTCPPFAPPFSKFTIFKKLQSRKSPESKINFV